MARWYVYRVNLAGKLAYIGKGCGKRLLISARRIGGVAGILEYFDREIDALKAERKLIAMHSPPLNKTAGGEGYTRRRSDRDAAIARQWRKEAYAAEFSGFWLDRLAAICFRKCEGILPTELERHWVMNLPAVASS